MSSAALASSEFSDRRILRAIIVGDESLASLPRFIRVLLLYITGQPISSNGGKSVVILG